VDEVELAGRERQVTFEILGQPHDRDRGDVVPDLGREGAQRRGGGSDAGEPGRQLVDALAKAR
jgi:hypothetical protein